MYVRMRKHLDNTVNWCFNSKGVLLNVIIPNTEPDELSRKFSNCDFSQEPSSECQSSNSLEAVVAISMRREKLCDMQLHIDILKLIFLQASR